MRTILIAFALTAALLSPSHAADSRLAQKVTYQGGYKRLHAIAEELTEQTGVAIRAGDNKQDWHVRDIPLVVCVKDMPLGTLLEHIAQCTHVRLAAEKVAGADENKPTYRLYRNKTRDDDIQAQLDAVAEANRKLARWAWDTLVTYANMPDASADIPTTKPHQWLEVDAKRIRTLAKALLALGPEGRARAAAGEQVTARVSSSPAFDAIYDYAVKSPGSDLMGIPAGEPTPQERAEALVALRIIRQDHPDIAGGFAFYVHGIPIRSGNDDSRRALAFWPAEPVQCAKTLAAVKKLKLPPPPDVDVAMASDEQFPDPDFKLLKADEDWETSDLQTTIKLDLPQTQSKFVTRAQVLAALARAAGMDIICEDFDSQKLPHYWSVRVDPMSETTPGSVLRQIARHRSVHWFLNSDTKTIVGWAVNWRRQHMSLVAESFITGLHAKREKSGLEIDDFVRVWDLSADQRTEWIRETPAFAGITCDSGACMWRLYSALTHEDKALAKTPHGLPLAKFDPNWLIDFMKSSTAESESRSVTMAVREESPSGKEIHRYLSDPDMIRKLVLKVWPTPLESWWIVGADEDGLADRDSYTPGPNGPAKHGYSISLTDPEATEDKLHMRAQWTGVAFPMYTPEREAELIKKAESNSGEKKPIE